MLNNISLGRYYKADSAVMTTEMVLEDLERDNVKMLDCPLVEGAVLAAVESAGGISLDDLAKKIDEVRAVKKLDN